MDAGDQDVLLFVRRELEQALSQVVAEAVDHKVCKVRIDLCKNHVSMLGIAFFELALKKAAPMLVFAQASHVALQIFEPQPSEAVDVVEALGLLGLRLLKVLNSTSTRTHARTVAEAIVSARGADLLLRRRDAPVQLSVCVGVLRRIGAGTVREEARLVRILWFTRKVSYTVRKKTCTCR